VVNAYLVSQWVKPDHRTLSARRLAGEGALDLPSLRRLRTAGLALALAYRALGVTGLLAFVAPPLMMQLSIKQYVERTRRR